MSGKRKRSTIRGRSSSSQPTPMPSPGMPDLDPDRMDAVMAAASRYCLAAVLGPGNDDTAAYTQADAVLCVLARHLDEIWTGDKAAVRVLDQLDAEFHRDDEKL